MARAKEPIWGVSPEPTRSVRGWRPTWVPATIPGELTLSTQGPNAVNARDRIGTGPWHNAQGTLIGNNVNELHGMGHRFTVMTVIDERGRRIPGSGYAPNRHDVLTGSQPDGTAYPAGEDMTCNNWTSSGDGKARLGHHDRAAWNSAHDSRACSQELLRATGGDGLFYCFVAQ